MGASGSTPTTTNGANQEEERQQESGGASTGLWKIAAAVGVAAVGVAAVGVAAVAMSQTRSDNIESEENENHALKLKSSYLANSRTNSHSGYESSHVSHPIDRALMSPGPYSMKTDGCCRPNQNTSGGIQNTPDDRVERGPSGFGGILRDERGRWVRGFIGFMDKSDCLTTEIHGIYYGLLLLDKLGLKGSILKSDCEQAINWITEGSSNPKRKVIKDCWDCIMKCRLLVEKNEITISHCSRKANNCADKLAEMAVEKRERYKEIMDVPYGIKEIDDN